MVSIKVEPIDRDVQLIIDQTLSPGARSQMFAADAQVFLDQADDTNRQILGRLPPNRTYVDGSEGRPLAQVTPDGVVVREYDLIVDVLEFIADQLRAVSPVKTGSYQASHTLYADGTETAVGDTIPDASEYVFLSAVVYARKIEGTSGRKPESPMAPKGVYEITALKASSQYGNIARISFTWRAPFNGNLLKGKAGDKSDGRVPAIVVKNGS